MPSFQDSKGRLWELELDILTCRCIDKSDFSAYYDEPFSMFKLEKEVVKKLLTDSSFAFAIIWAIVQPQAKEKYQLFLNNNGAIDSFPTDPANAEEAEIEFVSAINYKAKDEGQKALLEALADFFPELKTVLYTVSQQMTVAMSKIEEGTKQIIPLLTEMMDRDLNRGIEEMKRELRKTQDHQAGEVLSPSLP